MNNFLAEIELNFTKNQTYSKQVMVSIKPQNYRSGFVVLYYRSRLLGNIPCWLVFLVEHSNFITHSMFAKQKFNGNYIYENKIKIKELGKEKKRVIILEFEAKKPFWPCLIVIYCKSVT